MADTMLDNNSINNNNLEKKGFLYLKEFSKGIIKENPSLILLLGLCPTLAVTSKVSNAIGMGLSATFVLICSNFLISLLKNFIPDKIRIPSYIIIIASFVTIVDMLMNAFLPVLAKSLGIFIPLIVVNCIILGRAEVFANKNSPIISVLDGLGMGIGFTLALILIAFVREVLATVGLDFSEYGGSFLSFFTNDPEKPYILINGIEVYSGAKIFTLPAGALFVFGIILAIINAIKNYISNLKIKEKQFKE